MNLQRFISSILVLLFLLLTGNAHSFAPEERLWINNYSIENGLPQNSVYSIVKDKYGFMWFGTWGGVVRFDGYQFQVFKASENDSNAIHDNIIRKIYQDRLKNIWVQTTDTLHLYRLNDDRENFSKIQISRLPMDILQSLKNNQTSYKKKVRNDEYSWEITPDGLLQTNLKTGRRILYGDTDQAGSLPDKQLNCLYLDDQENLWIGTQFGGICQARVKHRPAVSVLDTKSAIALKENIIRAIAVDQHKTLWLGYENNGISMISLPKKQIIHHPVLTKLNKLNIRSLLCDSKDFVWIGTKSGLYRLDAKSFKLEHFSKQEHQLSDNQVYTLFEDTDGFIWTGTLNGLMRFDPVTGNFEKINSALMPGLRIRHIVQDQHKNLWIGTDDKGLIKWNYPYNSLKKEKIKLKQYQFNENDPNGLLTNRITSLATAGDKIYIGTNNGLSCLDTQTDKMQHYTVKTGLIDDIIMGIICDKNNDIWISHKKGITQFTSGMLISREFNQLDGISGTEFNQNAFFYDQKEENIYFGSTKGLTIINHLRSKPDPTRARATITQLWVNNSPVLPGTEINGQKILEKSLQNTNNISLSWWNKSFSLSFSALHFTNPIVIKYKYKLEGANDNWIFTDAYHRTVSYESLAPGKYTFLVDATNSDGIWSDAPEKLSIEILPPWWLSYPAILTYVLVLSTIIFYIFKRYKIKAQSTSLENQAQTPTTNAEFSYNITNQSDETFIRKAVQHIEMHLEDTAYTSEILAASMQMSRSLLYRRIKDLTNLTVHDFIISVRMNKARELLQIGDLTISEIAYKVGYSLPTNFSRTFVRHFGMTPSQFIENLKK